MKYWFYSEGNILGPYEPAEMLVLPAFAEESLVCSEAATGDSPGDWRPAAQVGEIAAALSFGSGRAITAGVAAGAYEYETGFNSSVRYFEDRESSLGERSPHFQDGGVSYGGLLGTIDNILDAYKKSPSASGKPAETDYDLAEKFDARLSRIQEELEAARWEKNLLLEKIRMKELEEKKNRARIEELEFHLKDERGKVDAGIKEFEQLRHLADLKEKAETVRQIEEIKKEELEFTRDVSHARRPAPAAELPLSQAAAMQPVEEVHPLKPESVSEIRALRALSAAEEKPGPKIEVKSFKSVARSSEIKLETSPDKDLKEEAGEPELTNRKFGSLGQTPAPAYVYDLHYDSPPPGTEAAPPGASNNPEVFKSLPRQAGDIARDFAAVTPKQSEISQQFQIETGRGTPAFQVQAAPAQFQPVKPPAGDFDMAQPASASIQQQAPQVPRFIPNPSSLAQQAPESQPIPSLAQLSPASVSREKASVAASDSPDKTVRVPVFASKGRPGVKVPEKAMMKGGRTAFLVILVIFGSMAAGGLGYFFMGEGMDFSEFSLLNLGSKKKPAALDSQLEGKAEPASAPRPVSAPETRLAPQPAPVEKPAGENIKKAIEIVKGYKLSGGRGNAATWFANSFLSGALGGANEEWTATPLHGDIFVVQYRLLRPRQEPLIYQFEVDAAKRDIVRGINNNAIELLDFSSREKSAAAAPARKSAVRSKSRKVSRPGEIPILPLPDAPPTGAQPEQDPTGFETSHAEGSEQVKYLKAQESDEELF